MRQYDEYSPATVGYFARGRSTQVSDGHDMDHYADDLAALTADDQPRERRLLEVSTCPDFIEDKGHY
jgi:hypothetical protein